MAIFKLKDQLQIGPTHSLPNRPSEIKIPKSFQIEEFEREVDELFAKYKKYTSSTVLGRIEDHAAEVFRENLMRPFCKDSNKVKFGIHHLLNMYPLKTFRFEATTFAKTVEREVLIYFSICFTSAGTSPTWPFLSTIERLPDKKPTPNPSL